MKHQRSVFVQTQEVIAFINCTDESGRLTALHDVQSWKSFLKAAEIRQYKPILDLVETLKDDEIPATWTRKWSSEKEPPKRLYLRPTVHCSHRWLLLQRKGNSAGKKYSPIHLGSANLVSGRSWWLPEENIEIFIGKRVTERCSGGWKSSTPVGLHYRWYGNVRKAKRWSEGASSARIDAV